MEDLTNMLLQISVPSHMVTSHILQEVLITAKRSNLKNANEEIKHIWYQVLDLLWSHLKVGLDKFDDQLLCGTCFYTVLNITKRYNEHFTHMLHIINDQLISRDMQEITYEYSENSMIVSLMYGMFQSAFFVKNTTTDISIINAALKSIFQMLLHMAYEYSQYTFIIFKTISSFKKVCGTNFQEAVLNKDHQIKLLNLVNHNWENPINGVKDLNKSIFHTLMTVMDNSLKQSVIEETNGFYWNKAKYFMIAGYLEQCDINISSVIKNTDWIEGTFYSLHKPGLVAAGTDLYFVILKKLTDEDEWCTLFLPGVLEVLNGLSHKAAENFANYWVSETLKKYPSLFNTFIINFETLNKSENRIYCILSIIKQGIKIRLSVIDGDVDTKYRHMEYLVFQNIEHCNTYFRMFAFDIVCQLQRKSLPRKMEYEIVLKFLKENVNSDSTILRLNMLHSLKVFLIQLHMLFINHSSKSQDDIQILLQFCKSLQEFIVNSLHLCGNYQRKITSIKITILVFSSFNEIPKKKLKQTKFHNVTLFRMLKDNGYWILSDSSFLKKLIEFMKDPTEDIRHNVNQLLLDHYSTNLKQTNILNYVIEEALKNIKSKFFYQINCGQSMFKLVASILLKEEQIEASFSNLEDIFYFVYDKFLLVYKSKINILESIENGTQLHSVIGVLQVILEVCLENAYKFEISKETLTELLNALGDVCSQFACEEKTLPSSDFSKMNNMVENIISHKSNINQNIENQTKISGLHQIVLNCLWLNVKAACDLTSLLIQYNMEDSHIDFCEKGLTNIIHVLETSRHKGVIEAAGAALGQIIQHLTSLPEVLKISKIPHTLLKRKLKEIILEASKMASVTRRGAGLSIMVHRIVSNDMKKRKPLFHYFMNTLLETCTQTEDLPYNMCSVPDIDNEKDLPKAIYIHFFTKVVMDSSLSSDVMYYSSKLAELAFSNLTNSHWQIRNAALQLYGALVPKLIGQKKVSGTDEETIATVGWDEFRTHSPKLWKYIESQLENDSLDDKLQLHSNLVPILNILANSAKRYNFSFDVSNRKDSDEKLLNSLILLLGSPIYTVRRLSAKCISNNFSYVQACNELIKQDFAYENILHGGLLLVELYRKYYSYHCYDPILDKIKEKLHNILNIGVHSYLCKILFEEIFDNDSDVDVNNVTQTLSELDNNMYSPGVSLWVNIRLKKYIKKMSWQSIPNILRIIINRNDFEYYCELLLSKIPYSLAPEHILLEVVNILLSFKNKFNSGIMWKILYHISLQIELRDLNVADICSYLENTEISYKLRYIIPFMARVSKNHASQHELFSISNVILNLTDPAKADVDMRYIAALANNEFGSEFDKLSDKIKINSLKSIVILLQDEDENVRNLSADFYSKLNATKTSFHPYICLHKILDYKFLHSAFTDSEFVIEILCKDLNNLLLSYSNTKTDEYNPFANDSKNIYLEMDVFRKLIEDIKIA